MKRLFNLILIFFAAPAFANAPTPPICDLTDRLRAGMAVAASNLANAETTRTPEGGPYQLKELICTPEDCETKQTAKIKIVYEPFHPDADADGYVSYPDIDVRDELAQMQMLVEIYEKAEEVCRRHH